MTVIHYHRGSDTLTRKTLTVFFLPLNGLRMILNASVFFLKHVVKSAIGDGATAHPGCKKDVLQRGTPCSNALPNAIPTTTVLYDVLHLLLETTFTIIIRGSGSDGKEAFCSCYALLDGRNEFFCGFWEVLAGVSNAALTDV
jgi:hypothetical protein